MSSGIIDFFKRHILNEPPLHPIDRRLAKEWIKRRLCVLFPKLRLDPVALEKAYRDFTIIPRPGRGGDEPETVFEIRLPDL